MSEIKQRVPIKESESLYIERLWYEHQGYSALMLQFMSDSPYKPDRENFNHVLTLYLESYAAYNLAWHELLYTYVPETAMDEGLSMYVDFNFNEIVILEKGEIFNGCKVCK